MWHDLSVYQPVLLDCQRLELGTIGGALIQRTRLSGIIQLAFLLVVVALVLIGCSGGPPRAREAREFPSTTEALVAPGAEPQAVSGGVLVGAGESIQAKVDAYPGGTSFVIGAGVHRGQEVRPKAGDTFVGEPGAVLDGGGTARWAFAAGVPNVTIRGLVVQNYATPSREGVIQWLAGGNSWLVEGNEVRDNAEIGIRGIERVAGGR